MRWGRIGRTDGRLLDLRKKRERKEKRRTEKLSRRDFGFTSARPICMFGVRVSGKSALSICLDKVCVAQKLRAAGGVVLRNCLVCVCESEANLRGAAFVSDVTPANTLKHTRTHTITKKGGCLWDQQKLTWVGRSACFFVYLYVMGMCQKSKGGCERSVPALQILRQYETTAFCCRIVRSFHTSMCGELKIVLFSSIERESIIYLVLCFDIKGKIFPQVNIIFWKENETKMLNVYDKKK
jgi:hypothetical protein